MSTRKELLTEFFEIGPGKPFSDAIHKVSEAAELLAGLKPCEICRSLDQEVTMTRVYMEHVLAHQRVWAGTVLVCSHCVLKTEMRGGLDQLQYTLEKYMRPERP
jgi:hypothetical protein